VHTKLSEEIAASPYMAKVSRVGTHTLYMQGARKSQSDEHEQQRKDNGIQDMQKPYNKNGLVAAVDQIGHLATCLNNLSASSPSSISPPQH
jgi:hypothetical protein